MTSVMVAHVISVNWDLGKGIKSIMDILHNKLGRDVQAIDSSVDTSYVTEELNDFDTLMSSRTLENKVKYNYNGHWMTFMELLSLIGKDIFSNNSGVLEKDLEICGMEPDEYIEMVTKCNAISKKYLH